MQLHAECACPAIGEDVCKSSKESTLSVLVELINLLLPLTVEYLAHPAAGLGEEKRVVEIEVVRDLED